MLKKLFPKDKTVYYYQTFTYFVPAPKQKSSSYREAKFDKELATFLKDHQLELLSIHSQSIASNQTEGIWIIAHCRGKNPVEENSIEKKASHIEGLYHLNSEDHL